jgi:hypothetical protein
MAHVIDRTFRLIMAMMKRKAVETQINKYEDFIDAKIEQRNKDTGQFNTKQE